MTGRGPHPEDARDLGEAAVPRLRFAVAELSDLLGRGYAEAAALKLVGDHLQLSRRQREVVRRAALAPAARHRRAGSRVRDLEGRDVAVDGFNVLLVVERALDGGPIVRGADGAWRDLGGVHGSYRLVGSTDAAAALVAAALVRARAAEVVWVLDRPVSNSFALAGRLRAAAPALRPWRVEVVADADGALAATGAVVATSDGGLIDRGVPWTDLVGPALGDRAAWRVDLSLRDD